MTYLGKQIELKGRTHKGKNRVREHGNKWTVLAETDHILFAPNQSGPWLFLTPAGCNMHNKASRWVHLNNDPDFEVLIL